MNQQCKTFQVSEAWQWQKREHMGPTIDSVTVWAFPSCVFRRTKSTQKPNGFCWATISRCPESPTGLLPSVPRSWSSAQDPKNPGMLPIIHIRHALTFSRDSCHKQSMLTKLKDAHGSFCQAFGNSIQGGSDNFRCRCQSVWSMLFGSEQLGLNASRTLSGSSFDALVSTLLVCRWAKS